MSVYPYFFCMVGVLLFGVHATVVPIVSANGRDHATLASPIPIAGEVHDGDVVSYDDATATYRAAQAYADRGLFGVVVDDPLLYMDPESDDVTIRPVVRYGEVVVNVSTLEGELVPGDYVTSSRIPGYGARFDTQHTGYVLGFVNRPFEQNTRVSSVEVDGVEVRFGTVGVALQIGLHVPNDVTGSIVAAESSIGEGAGVEDAGVYQSIDPFKVFRYVLGSLVAIMAVVLALRRFGDLFAQSIISVGRNPLARSQIRSILVWNAVLIIVVSSVGLGVGIAIIVFP